MSDAIDKILKSREAARPVETPQVEDQKFFSIMLGEGMHEEFLELKYRDGTRTCFPYSGLVWFDYFPENGISMSFGGYMVHIEGRGLEPKLWNALKQKRVAWIQEADLEFQDNEASEAFVREITIHAPEGFAEEDEEE